MKRQKIFSGVFCFIFVLVSFWVTAEDTRNNPVAISPGSDSEMVSIWQSCPVFSWSAVEKASAYRIAVFEVLDQKLILYKDAAAMTSPVINKDIPGFVSEWTLPMEERLKIGSIYAWYIQALDANGNALGEWSRGRIFKVKHEGPIASIEEKLGEILKKYDVSKEIITRVLKDMNTQTKAISTPDSGLITITNNTDKRSEILGYEGIYKTYYGLYAGQNNTAGGITFMGYQAGRYNTTGSANTFIGNDAGLYNTTGNYNTFIGYETGYNNKGNSNTFVGEECGFFNTTGYSNTFLGQLTGQHNNTGMKNTFIGQRSGISNTSGYENTFIGYMSGNLNITGYENMFLGVNAGYENSTGYRNIFLGNDAGHSNSSGYQNVLLGYKSGYNETGSNKLYISNSDTNSPLIYGEFDNKIVTIHGKLGINTKTPDYPMELEITGQDAAFSVKRIDGATNFMSATVSYAQFGAVSNHPVRILVNNAWKMRLNTDGSLSMSNGAYCTAGGTWTNASSRNLKENIQPLSSDEAMATLNRLNPVKFNYKVDKTDKHVGFIAEDAPDLVAMKDKKGMSPMDIVAVLTKVVQEQQKTIAELKEKIASFKSIK